MLYKAAYILLSQKKNMHAVVLLSSFFIIDAHGHWYVIKADDGRRSGFGCGASTTQSEVGYL
jgi:hypothetical protein